MEFQAFLNQYEVVEILISHHHFQGESRFFYGCDVATQVMMELPILAKEYLHEQIKYVVQFQTFQFGKEYEIVDEHCRRTPLLIEKIVKLSKFDQTFFYSGPLGSIYCKDSTTFYLWAPTAYRVYLEISHSITQVYPLVRGDRGVYSISLLGDYEFAQYRYFVHVNGRIHSTIDPYAFSSTLNGTWSVIINPLKEKVLNNQDCLPEFNTYCDAIIYETSVRDFSSDQKSSFVYKGKFKAFQETGLKNEANYPIGLDYLKWLGITHLQLMPVQDFASVDEKNPDIFYNWGYDPLQFFCLEGSYSTTPEEPYCRIKEFKQMISTLHLHGIRVNVDFVMNHVFERKTSSFEKIVPFYYFSFFENGNVSNGSFCGNDLDCKMFMFRRLVLDVCSYYVKEMGIDGIRFDLMGIFDYQLINEVQLMCKDLNPNIMIYGEGWDLPTALEQEKKAKIDNSHTMPHIAFFNDRFRNSLKGSPFNHDELGLLFGNLQKLSDVNSILTAQSSSHLFLSSQQSINYIECHDNYTFYDKQMLTLKHQENSIRMDRQKLALAFILLSQGVPFLHSGMEFCRSKNLYGNSYNSGNEINAIHWDELSKNYIVAKYCSQLIEIRKKYACFRDFTIKEIQVFANSLIYYCLKEKDFNIQVFINCTLETKETTTNGHVIFSEHYKKATLVQNVSINPLSILILQSE